LRVAGTWLNVIGIVLGSVCGLIWKKPLSTANQVFIKLLLGAITVLCGLRLTWASFHGTFLQNLKLLLIVVVAMGLGRVTGRLLRFQSGSNRIGQFARRKMESTKPNDPNRFSDGFAICGLLFCAAPLGILGALSDGLSDYFYPLAVKAVMDGLGAMAFVGMFGVGVTFSAVPVLVFQGTLSLIGARYLLPFLESHQLLDPVTATIGLLIFTVSLIIFEIKKIEVTDYLPSLIYAPALAFWLK
jgi:uncharacterized membrane protein YqgA involved in biofilm formation